MSELSAPLKPSMRHILPTDYRVMPWKNGLGTTTEIAVEPPGASLDAFVWRVSIADLRASGPFSTFEQVDRIIVLIEGAPMTLTHEGGRVHRLTLLSPYRFAGEIPTQSDLDAPPSRDFNVMVRRGSARADLAVHELAAGETMLTPEGVGEILLYLLRGEATVRGDGEALCVRGNETVMAKGRLAVVAVKPAVVLTVMLGFDTP